MSSYRSSEVSPNLVLAIPPLTFDRLYKGYTTASAFPLFQLPVELFLHVLKYLTTKDLKALSLVDRVCMRLAMPSLYKDVTLYYPFDKWHPLLGDISLSTDGLDTLVHSFLHINPCVRRLAIALSGRLPPNHSTITRYHSSALENTPPQCSVRALCYAVEKSLPNLHILDWDLPIIISPTTLQSLFSSPIKHLRLEGAVLDPGDCISYGDHDLPLETLSLNISLTSAALQRHAAPHQFFANFFRRTHSTLRQLRWTGYFEFEEIYVPKVPDQFPRLRSLTLDTIARNSDNVIQLLLGPLTRVEALAMDTMTPSACSFFGTRGYVAPLKHFCWLIHDQGDSAPFSQILEFISNNSQLETLHIPGPISPSFLSQLLLPNLQHFKNLTSLHLIWASPAIHEEALVCLTSIHSLRHLWLSAGNQFSNRNTWEVNHEVILTYLSRLPRLLTLAFSRDTYPVNAHPLAPRSWDYYSSNALPVDLDISKYLSPPDFDMYLGKSTGLMEGWKQQSVLRCLAWEKWHAESMLSIGHRYGCALPNLNWLFVGQLVLVSNRFGSFEFASQPPQRDTGLTALQKKMSLTLWRPV